MIDRPRYNGEPGYANRPCNNCTEDECCYNSKGCDEWGKWFRHSWACFNRYAKKQAEIQSRMQGGTDG